MTEKNGAASGAGGVLEMEGGVRRGEIEFHLDLSDLRELVECPAVTFGKKGVADLHKIAQLLAHLLGNSLERLGGAHLQTERIRKRRRKKEEMKADLIVGFVDHDSLVEKVASGVELGLEEVVLGEDEDRRRRRAAIAEREVQSKVSLRTCFVLFCFVPSHKIRKKGKEKKREKKKKNGPARASRSSSRRV